MLYFNPHYTRYQRFTSMGLWQQSYIFAFLSNIWYKQKHLKFTFLPKNGFYNWFYFYYMILAVFVLYESYEYTVSQTAKD